MEPENNTLQALLDIISPQKLLAVVVLVIAVWLLLLVLQWLLNQTIEKFPRQRLLLGRIYPLARIFIWSSTFIYALVGIIAPHQSVLFALLGSAGLALGLAAQEPLKNMVAGLIIMFNPPYRVGDMVTLAGYYGEVIRLDWSVTWLRTFDDNTVMVPNAEALRTAVANSNSGALDEQISVRFSLPIGVDHQQALNLAREASLCCPYVLLKKPVLTQLESGIEYGVPLVHITVKAWVVDVRLERRCASDIQLRVLDAFKVAGLLSVTVAPLPQS